MVVVKIVSPNKYTISGVHVYENNENGEVFVQDDYHCEAVEDGFDDIFGTNDEKIVVTLKSDLLIRSMAQEIVKYLLKEHGGETYDEERRNDCVQDLLDESTGYMREELDKIMDNFTEEDNLTIMNCPHKCSDCVDTYDHECVHGCGDCGFFDGGNCIHSGSYNCGCLGDCCAYDCSDWDNGE